MAKTIQAIYQNGVFKPLTKVRFKNRQKVKLTIVESEKRSKPSAQPAANRRPMGPGGAASHPAYRIGGLFKSGVHDLSKNHEKPRGG